MAYNDLRDFINALEKRGMLKRIKTEVSSELEISEILDRNSKNKDHALLFENVNGSEIPVLANAFGSIEQMKLALERDCLEDIGNEMISLIKEELPNAQGISDKLKMLSKLKEISSYFPRTVRTGPCKEVIIRWHDVNLNKFPILKCWPHDGGRFITLPLVFTKDPETKERNCGMYRMQVFDEKTTGMHWHVHKHGAEHFRKAEKLNQKLEVAVAIGTEPITTYAATAPLPDNFDEMLFAGFLRKKGVEMVKCETVDLEVPASSEIVLEGYVNPKERHLEGPFGDHTGYYSLSDMYPVFHVTCITHRKNPIYSATVVGKPPMEDSYIGKATERIFLPFIKLQIPEIVDMNLPIEGVFHNLCIVSINKKYPGHAKKVMLSLWGMGQMMFTKVIIVLDADVNVQNIEEVLWAMSNRIDPKRDTLFIENAPMDVLEHATDLPNIGSKMGIDATKKWKDEGFTREWPDVIEMDEKTKKLVGGKWKNYGFD
ncbi:MAG: menaquinone biosynthesis decarboxylase [Candidatus Altiarchaeales archaeon IMC4]|nr:MAG: menaquinone biosynthesis decarboxylase [Candidatus Altiarchaeales archaeon IMC4]